MSIDTTKLRRIASNLNKSNGSEICLALGEAADELDRLQRIIDSRPAINAGLVAKYTKWSQSIYAMEAAHASETKQ